MTEPGPEGPLVPEDDRSIGRAFRRSLVAIAGLAALAGAVLVLSMARRPPAPEAFEEPLLEGPVLPRGPGAGRPPSVRFTDVTSEAGIDFRHVNGAVGGRLLPETMGGGCAFFDYDADGDPDLLLINSDHWPENRDGRPRPTMALFRNDGAGGFEDVTAGSGLDVSGYGMGVAVGDIDGDGLRDVFITALGPNRLLRNEGGAFREITARAGVAGGPEEWSTGAAFFDSDNDGDLDLFVVNYVGWSREIDFEIDFRLTGIGRAYGPPTSFEGTHPYLYRNEGNGTFTDVSAQAGLRVVNPATGLPMAKGLAVAPVDLDRDGWMDLIVANDTVQNQFFHNRGDGTFAERGAALGVAFDRDGGATGAMGIDTGYFRDDGSLGVAIGNFSNEMTSLYVAQGTPLQFADEAIVAGVGAPSRLALTFGLFFFDYDLDGRLDLLQVNGHLEERINRVQSSQHYRQPPQLFWNAGSAAGRSLVAAPRGALGDLGEPLVGRGAAYADVDGDGDLDVLITQVEGAPRLLRNDQGLGHHWLRVRLVGREANRDAIGAWVELVAGGTRQERQLMPTRSYLSQVEIPVTFGLGTARRVESLSVTWPGGQVQGVEDPPVDTTLEIVQE